MATQLAQSFPQLMFLSWSTGVADKAATAFASGFYEFLASGKARKLLHGSGARSEQVANSEKLAALREAYLCAKQKFIDQKCEYRAPQTDRVPCKRNEGFRCQRACDLCRRPVTFLSSTLL